MNKKDLILNILLFISQIIVFYYFFCYLFPFKEQLQMFQFTSQYLSPNDPHFWLEHGVSIKVRNRAIAFMQKVQDISRSGQNPAVALASEYGKTYWYYYMFNMMDK